MYRVFDLKIKLIIKPFILFFLQNTENLYSILVTTC